MLVQRVLMPVSSLESWTVLGDGGGPVEPIERYLAYLTDIERSPNTIKAYAHDLKDWFDFLDLRRLDWREVRLEDLGEFVAWLRVPPAGRCGGVAMLPSAEHHCSGGTVNRKLSAVSGLYTFHARHGVGLGDLVTELQPARRRRSGWKPFLYHLSGGEPERRRAIKLKTARKQPMILTAGQVQAILDACTRLRDRLLWAFLWDTGCFLAWLDQNDHALTAATQDDIDTWHAQALPSHKHATRGFLTWAIASHLMPRLALPPLRSRRAGQPLNVSTLRTHIHQLGIPSTATRVAALRQLVLQTPAPVLAKALGFHYHTTHRHNIDAGGTGKTYAPGDHGQ